MTVAASRAALTAIRYQVGTLRPVQDLLDADVPIEKVNELLQKGVTGYSELEQFPSELLVTSIRSSLDAAGVAPPEVDAVILITESFARLFDLGAQNGDMFRNVRNQSFDFLSELGINKASVFCASYGGCTNLLQAALLAQTLIDKGLSRNVLLVAAEKFASAQARLMDEAISIAGDGIANCLVTSCAAAEPGSFRFHHLSTAPYKKFQMEGDVPNLLLEMFRAMKNAAADCYDACGWQPDDFRWLVLGDYNRMTSITYGKLLGFPPERIFMENVGKMGHIPFDPLISLQNLHEQNKIASGEPILLFLCGPVSCGSMVVETI